MMKIKTPPFNAVRRMASGLYNIMYNVKTDRDDKVEAMIRMFQNSYPRLKENPEQRIMLKQMCGLYVRLEFELIPALDKYFDNGDFVKYRQLSGTVTKFYQQWDRLMSKLGFAFTSKPYVTAKERKNHNPKANQEVQENVAEFMQNVTDQTEEDEVEA